MMPRQTDATWSILAWGFFLTSDQDNRVRFQARPQIHEGPRIIDSGVLNADSYDTGNLEFAWVWGPVTLQSEAFASVVNFNSGASETSTAVTRTSAISSQVRIEFLIRLASMGLSSVGTFLIPMYLRRRAECGWGAWEGKIRYSNLDLTNVNRGIYDDITAGVNWYWSDRVRIMFDWIHPFHERRCRLWSNGIGYLGNSVRLQLVRKPT
jgi:phosphate-selective porin OprO and OprP